MKVEQANDFIIIESSTSMNHSSIFSCKRFCKSFQRINKIIPIYARKTHFYNIFPIFGANKCLSKNGILKPKAMRIISNSSSKVPKFWLTHDLLIKQILTTSIISIANLAYIENTNNLTCWICILWKFLKDLK